jgi:hypothetical protein
MCPAPVVIALPHPTPPQPGIASSVAHKPRKVQFYDGYGILEHPTKSTILEKYN